MILRDSISVYMVSLWQPQSADKSVKIYLITSKQGTASTVWRALSDVDDSVLEHPKIWLLMKNQDKYGLVF